uniref:Uncharacterized protein n=1 Tax=Romanomermis culicivorax TaxID=13658 RepID=A0A915IU01_ROMCU
MHKKNNAYIVSKFGQRVDGTEKRGEAASFVFPTIRQQSAKSNFYSSKAKNETATTYKLWDFPELKVGRRQWPTSALNKAKHQKQNQTSQTLGFFDQQELSNLFFDQNHKVQCISTKQRRDAIPI